MGIDIYARWDGMTEADKGKQYCGFRIDAGNVGYLREAYHGEPYATVYLVKEAFEDEEPERDDDGDGLGTRIPAATLRARLPETIRLAIERGRVVYHETLAPDDPALKAFTDFVELCERKEAETGKPVRIYASY